MKCASLFLVFSLVVLMAEPGDAFFHHIVKGLFKVGHSIYRAVKNRWGDRQLQDQQDEQDLQDQQDQQDQQDLQDQQDQQDLQDEQDLQDLQDQQQQQEQQERMERRFFNRERAAFD